MDGAKPIYHFDPIINSFPVVYDNLVFDLQIKRYGLRNLKGVKREKKEKKKKRIGVRRVLLRYQYQRARKKEKQKDTLSKKKKKKINQSKNEHLTYQTVQE